MLVADITSRFDQPRYTAYRNLQTVLTRAHEYTPAVSCGVSENFTQTQCEAAVEVVCELYGEDLDKEKLRDQLKVFGINLPQKLKNIPSVKDMISYIKSLSTGRKENSIRCIVSMRPTKVDALEGVKDVFYVSFS